MIDMGVAENHRVDLSTLERELVPVAGFGLTAALDHAAVEQHP